jgi:hypothetical protein
MLSAPVKRATNLRVGKTIGADQDVSVSPTGC